SLTGPSGTPGLLPGSTSVQVSIGGHVAPGTPPGQPLTTCATIATSTGEGANADANSACVDAQTPLPDLLAQTTAPATAYPGDSATVVIAYDNISRQASNPAAVIISVPAVGDAAHVDVIGATAPPGVVLYYASTPASAGAPAFDPASPGAAWSTTPTSGTTFIAAYTGAVAGQAGPKNIHLQVALVDPATGDELAGGESLEFCGDAHQVVGDPTAEDDLTNNASCATIDLPGVNVAAALSTTPAGSVPGVVVGERVSLAVTAANHGTVNAFGVVVTPALASGLTYVSDDALVANIVDANGNAALAVDSQGTPILGAIPITKVGSDYYLGNDNGPTDPLYYRNIGLQPDTSFTFGIEADVQTAVADGTALVSTVHVATHYQLGWDPQVNASEEYLTDNDASASVTAYKADISVAKTMAPADGAAGAVTVGDVIDVNVDYNNLGGAAAGEARFTDLLPANAAFVPSSLSGVPVGFTVEYTTDGVTWGAYESTVAAGAADPAIRGFRLLGDLPSPANNTFSVAGNGLAPGDFVASDLTAGRVRSTGLDSSYTSVVIPESGTTIQSYGSVVIGGVDGAVAVSVLDADGTPIAGFEDLVPDVSSAVDLSALDAAAHPQIRIRVSFLGEDGFASDFGVPDTQLLPTPGEAIVPEGRIYVNDRKDVLVASYLTYPNTYSILRHEMDGSATRLDLGANPGGHSPVYFDDDVLVMSSGYQLLIYVRDGAGEWSPTYTFNAAGYMNLQRYNFQRRTDGLLEIAFHESGTNGGTGTGRIIIQDDAAAGGFRTLTVTYPFANNLGVKTVLDDGTVIALGSGIGWIAYVPNADSTAFTQNNAGYPPGQSGNVSVSDATSRGSSVCGRISTPYNDAYVVHERDGDWVAELLPTYSGSTFSDCYRSNENGLLFGIDTVNGNTTHYVVWVPDGAGGYTEHDLPTIPGVSGLSAGNFKAFTRANKLIFSNYSRVAVWTVDTTSGVNITGETVDMGIYTDGYIYISSNDAVNMTDGTTVGEATDPYTYQYVQFILRPDAGAPAGYTLALMESPDPVGFPRLEAYYYAPSVDGFTAGTVQDNNYNEQYVATFQAVSGATFAEARGYPLSAGYAGELAWVGGFYGVGHFENPDDNLSIGDENATVLVGVGGSSYGFEGREVSFDYVTVGDGLAWYPEDGATPDGMAYYLLPEPFDLNDTRPVFVSPDGFAVGAANGPRVRDYYDDYIALAWQPDGMNGWSVRPLRVDGDGTHNIRMHDVEQTAYYGSYAGNFVFGGICADSGYDGCDQGVVIVRDARAETGFAVLRMPGSYAYPGNSFIDAPSGVVAGRRDDGTPVVVTADADGANNEEELPIPPGATFQDLSDAWGGFVTGHVRTSDGNPHAVRWQRDSDGDWTVVDFGLDVGYPVQIGPDGAVLVFHGPDFLVGLTDASGAPYTVPVTLPSGVTALNPSFFGTPALMPSVRDGYVTLAATTATGQEAVVLRLPRSGEASATLTTLYAGSPRTLAYHQNGNYIVQDGEGTGYLVRSGDGTYSRVSAPAGYQYVELQTAYHAGSIALIDPTKAVAGWRPWLGGDDVVSLDTQLAGSTYFLANPDASVYRLGTPSEGGASGPLEVWGLGRASKASFDALAVSYRSTEVPHFSYQMQVLDVCQSSLSNTITASTTTPQSSQDNDQSTATLGVDTADLAVAIAADKTLVQPGDALTYTVTVTNNGPGAVTGATYTFTPPSGLGSAVTGDAVTGGGALGAGQSRTFTFPFTVPALADGASITATASVSATTPYIDCDDSNEHASATVTNSNLPNVYVTLSGSPTGQVGTPFSVTMTWGNNSAAAADDVAVTFVAPTGYTLVGTPQTSFTGLSLAPGATGTATFELVASSCDAVGATATSTATITAPNDTFAADNAASADTAIGAPDGELSVDVIADRASVPPGGLVRWTIHYRNDGATVIPNASLVATAPANGTLVPGSLSAGAVVGSDVVVSLGTLQPGVAGAVSFATIAGADGAQSGDVVFSGDGACPVTADYPVVPNAAVAITAVKVADRAQACGDGQITWRISVSNVGAATVSGLTVRDVVPAGATLVGGSLFGGDARSAAGAPTLTWTIADLAPGEGLTVGFKTLAPASNGALVSNVATVSQGGAVVATTNEAAIRVACDGRVELRKALDKGCMAPGEDVTVTLSYANTTGADLADVVIRDVVPSDLAYGSGGSYDAGTGVVTFAVGAVPVGATGSVSFTATIGAGSTSGTLVLDSASLAATGAQPVVSNGVAAVVVVCDDGLACTVDACDPGLGCVASGFDVGASCDTGDLCNPGQCDASGACVGVPVVCDDGDPCNGTETCNSGTGACMAGDPVVCSDGDACNGVETCNSSTGACEAG
ncbi:MAG: DUF11 domain-containing protein, partial [Myxococcales bacterium]|nr:DUF11 domain-containing protein [Myxococcales bacterium]